MELRILGRAVLMGTFTIYTWDILRLSINTSLKSGTGWAATIPEIKSSRTIRLSIQFYACDCQFELLEDVGSVWNMLTCFDTGQNNPNTHGLAIFLWLVQCYPGHLRSQKNSSSFKSMSKWHHRQLYKAMCQDIMACFSENILNQYKSLLVTYFIPPKSMGKIRQKKCQYPSPKIWGRHF